MSFKNVIKGSFLLGTAQVIAYASSFARNVVLARVLTKDDFGVAATLSLTITAFELSSKMSIGQQVVQSKHGDDDGFLSTAHFCQFVCGAIGTVLLASFAIPMADIFHVPQARWAFLTISLLGIINGLQHLDVMRSMRTLAFGRRAALDAVPEVLLTATIIPLALAIRDYRVIVVLMFLKSIFSLVTSHRLASRPYRWTINPVYVKDIVRFGWPLVINALLMFGYQQGDQMLIGSGFSLASLAQYSLATSITMIPGYMFQYVLNTLMLPLLSQVQNHATEYARRYILCTELSVFVGVLISCFMLLNGEWIIVFFFGQKYAGAGLIVGCLAVANALRIVRCATVLAAMARADTANNMISNIFRVSSFPLAIACVVAHAPIAYIAAAGIVGEALALAASWYRLSARCGISVWSSARPALVGAGALICAGMMVIVGVPNSRAAFLLIADLAIGLAAVTTMWLAFSNLRTYMLDLIPSLFRKHASAVS